MTGSLAHSGDAPQLPWLLHVTDRYFDIEQVLADGAYLSQKNIKTIADLGAEARIPFRETSVYHSPRTEGGRLWNGLLQFFKEHRKEYDEDYDGRNNVESTNSGVKRLMGSITRSKHPTVRVNEVLARAVATTSPASSTPGTIAVSSSTSGADYPVVYRSVTHGPEPSEA